MRKRNLTPEQRAALRGALEEVRAELGAIRARLEHRLTVHAEREAVKAHRRARLRRLSFGLLGR